VQRGRLQFTFGFTMIRKKMLKCVRIECCFRCSGVLTQHVTVGVYRRFETTYWSRIKG
jgi:hypothetical protein